MAAVGTQVFVGIVIGQPAGLITTGGWADRLFLIILAAGGKNDKGSVNDNVSQHRTELNDTMRILMF